MELSFRKLLQERADRGEISKSAVQKSSTIILKRFTDCSRLLKKTHKNWSTNGGAVE